MSNNKLIVLLKALNSKQRKTLINIFTEPTRSDIRWGDVENLFKALGANMAQGRGSRLRVAFNNKVATFHKPHPNPEIKKYAVKKIKDFLEEAGISQNLITASFQS